MESLGPIFGSLARVKLLRLFIFNRALGFTVEEIVERAKLSPREARDELAALMRAGFLKKSGVGASATYRTNMRYEHLEPLSVFVRATTAIAPRDLLARFRKAGTLELVILSGVFTGASESSADLLVVGDKLDERTLARTVRAIEAELGREIRYASFTTEDFTYRQGIYDRLLRDIFDYPHQTLYNRLGL